MAGDLGRTTGFQNGLRPGRARRQTEVLRPRHVPLPLRRRSARRSPRGLHGHRCRRPDTSGCRASTSSTRWAGTPSACPPNAPQFAKASTPPRSRKRNIDTFRRQIRRLGFSYDWDREVATASADYYRWTQWIFLKLYEQGPRLHGRRAGQLVPGAAAPCSPTRRSRTAATSRPAIPVERRLMRQWMLKITAYAERLLDDLEGLDWPESVKEMQRNWIGKSRGADVVFEIAGQRPRLHGLHHPARHPVRRHLLRARTRAPARRPRSPPTSSAPAVEAYVKEAAQQVRSRPHRSRERRRPASSPAPTPSTRSTVSEIPIWVADYVLMAYGTGAIMAVPGHDERDHEFAREFDLPIVEVVSGSDRPIEEAAFTDNTDGVMVNSTGPSGLASTGSRFPTPSRRSPPGWKSAVSAPGGSSTASATGSSRASATGASPSPSSTPTTGEVVALDESCSRSVFPPIDEYRPTEDGTAAARPRRRRLAQGRAPRRPDGHPRDQHHAAMGRQLLVLPALHRSAQRSERLVDRSRELLDARRPLRRRRRARGAPPALRPLLAQGALRLRLVSPPRSRSRSSSTRG